MIEGAPWSDARQVPLDLRVLERLQRVLDAWTQRGWTPVALPWMAPEPYMAATRPDTVRWPEPATHEGALVASGEQAFLWLAAHDRLPPAAHGWIGWSPCFRHEAYDPLHQHYFLKAELFAPLDTPDMESVLRLARQVTGTWYDLADTEGRDPEARFHWAATDDLSGDLLLDGIELGSYGVRAQPGQRGWYLYGTALAEPRWSRAWAQRVGDRPHDP